MTGVQTCALPISSQSYDTTYGGVYIREKTGEILSLDEMDSYFVADRNKAEAEWERLRKEAGKLDVSLYSKLIEMAAGDTVKVIIYPAFIETAAIQKQFEALKAKYPEFTSDLPKLSEMFTGGYYTIELPEPMILREGIPVDLPLELTESEQGSGSSGVSTPSFEGRPALKDDNQPNDEYWQRYSAFQSELEEIRRAGLQIGRAHV